MTEVIATNVAELPMSPQIQAVIFDMDGVIIDSKPFHKKSWQSFCADQGYTLSDEEFEKIFGRRCEDIIRTLFGTRFSDSEVIACGKEIDRRFRSLIAEHVEPIRGLREFLAELASHNIPLALATSGSIENIELILGSLHLKEKFQVIVSEKDVKRGKPEPEIYLITAHRLGMHPEQCVVFEDSVSGITAAKRAGMRCITLTTTHQREELKSADLIINDFTEIDLQKLAGLNI